MKPFGVISDVHGHEWSQFSTVLPSGINSRLKDILNEVRVAAKDTVAAGGDTLYITGDLFHVRGSVSPKVLNPIKDEFTDITQTGGIKKIVILTGNHDLESRNSEKLSNACEALSSIAGVTVVSSPQIFLDEDVVMIPWYDSMDVVRAKIKEAVAEITDMGFDHSEFSLMLHVPLNSVLVGIPDHGFYAKELERLGFKRVFCGHYHNHKRFDGEVYSVGATTHQTWSDVNTKAGHLIVTDAGVTHVDSSAPKFIDYDLSWDDGVAAEAVANNFVRVGLGEATAEDITMIREHIEGLGAKGVLVQAVPVIASAATARTTATVKAPTIGESVNEWIKLNSGLTDTKAAELLCKEILDEAEAVAV